MFNPHNRAPEFMRKLYKKIQKYSIDQINQDADIADYSIEKKAAPRRLRVVKEYSEKELSAAFNEFIYNEPGIQRQKENREATARYTGSESQEKEDDLALKDNLLSLYEFADFPGLQLAPHFVPIPVQKTLLSRLLHRDLSHPQHNNNVRLHYHISLPSIFRSYFDIPPCNDPVSTNKATRKASDNAEEIFYPPRDTNIHAPVSHTAFLNRKLRWITLGAQYDWTKKIYPSVASPPKSSQHAPTTTNHDSNNNAETFSTSQAHSPLIPPDISALLATLFPEMRPDAAIVNVYSPGDALSVHRDVSEVSDAGLVSVSVGCDCIFIAGLEKPNAGDGGMDGGASEDGESSDENSGRAVALRLHSGDVLFMTGEARWAWHGVPLVVKGTCPTELADWPAEPEGSAGKVCRGEESGEEEQDRYEAWRGWMSNKRINLNVRQL